MKKLAAAAWPHGSEVLGDLAHELLEGQFADEQPMQMNGICSASGPAPVRAQQGCGPPSERKAVLKINLCLKSF
jgi:hypothetical protein